MYSSTCMAQYGIQMTMRSIQLLTLICSRVTAHPLASSNRINIKEVLLKISKMSPMTASFSLPTPFMA
uniref:Putative secreted protein n=1 Tax=Anopheles darlingi TaxID=43151 RepID=A0A2M4DRB6_ANODA